MPIYEYRCPACGETVEKIQSQAVPAINCPACGKQAARAVSVFASGPASVGGGCPTPPAGGFG